MIIIIIYNNYDYYVIIMIIVINNLILLRLVCVSIHQYPKLSGSCYRSPTSGRPHVFHGSKVDVSRDTFHCNEDR